MKLRTKTLITAALLSFLIFVSLELITVIHIQPSFAAIEKTESIESITHASHLLNYRISDAATQVKDYAFWDDTYDYCQTLNQEYIVNNFADSTFENLNLNLVAIVDNNMTLIYCQLFDTNNSIKIPTTENAKALVLDSSLWSFDAKTPISGIALVDNKPMIIASAPVLTSFEQEPAMGGMLFGTYFDAKQISQLTDLLGLNFSLHTAVAFKNFESRITESLLSSQEAIIVNPKSPNSISAYTIVRDVHANPAFILEVTQDRTVYRQGALVGDIFLISAVMLALGFGVVMFLLLEREIVKPITRLATFIEKLSTNLNLSAPATIKNSSEELEVLTHAVATTLKKKLEGINETSRMVAHDLRNPLTGIRGASYVLKKNYGQIMDDRGRSMLKTIEDCVEYSNKIVENLVEFSSEIKLDKIKLSAKTAIDDALSKFVIPKRIHLFNASSNECVMLVDPEKIDRVFMNLILNALDAMPSGGTLTIDSKNVGKYVQINIADTGIGMSEEVLTKLWTPFFTTKAKGMGVGLSICRRIVDAHGGRIEVQSVEGKGTCFAVFLPLAN